MYNIIDNHAKHEGIIILILITNKLIYFGDLF